MLFAVAICCNNLYLPVLSADNFCEQLGPRSGLTERRAWSGSKQFDIMIVCLKDVSKKRQQ